MYTKYIPAAAVLLSGSQWLVAGQEPQPGQISQLVHAPLGGCETLQCSGTASNSVCSTSNQTDDVTQTTLVGIAPGAVNLTSDTQLSLTLIETGRTQLGNAPGLEAYERTLYVGLPSSLAKVNNQDGNRPPAACALMLQYQSQTFPLPDESSRDGNTNGTTSCNGILSQECIERFTTIIQSFNSTSGEDKTTDCAALASHVNARVRSQLHFCNLYANLVTVTGAPLFNTSVGAENGGAFPQDTCRPTVPDSNVLHRVGSVQTIVENTDARIGGVIFGGRQGFTPIITTVYAGEGGKVSSVQYACMQAVRPSGQLLGDTSAASSVGGVRFIMAVLAAMATGLVVL